MPIKTEPDALRCAERARTRRRAFRLALLTAIALIAASPVVASAADAIGAEVMPASALHAADPQPPALPASAAAPIALPSFSEQESARLADAQSESGPVRIGFGRTLPAPSASAASARWHALPDGRHAAAWRISSPGALGLRLQLRVLRLPDDATLRFFPPGAEPVQGVSGAAINASLRQDAEAGASGEAAQRYWSPLIQGDTLTLEIELPAGVDPQAVQIALPRLSHVFRLPFAETGPAAARRPAATRTRRAIPTGTCRAAPPPCCCTPTTAAPPASAPACCSTMPTRRPTSPTC